MTTNVCAVSDVSVLVASRPDGHAANGIQKNSPGSRMTYSRLIGALFLVGFLFYGVGAALVTSVTGAPDFLSTISAHQRTLVIGASLMLLNTVIDVGKGVLFFPILENHGKRSALAYLAFIIVQVVMLDVGVLALLLIVPLGQQATDAGQANAAWAQGLGSLLIQWNTLAYSIGEATLGVGGLFLCSVLFRTRLIPRFLAVGGFIGYVSLIVGMIAEIFGIHVSLMLSIPGIFFEVGLPVWLFTRGFRSEPYSGRAELAITPPVRPAQAAPLPKKRHHEPTDGLGNEAAMTDKPLMVGKTILITGGTGGIGKGTAVGLARLGARVGITGRDIKRAEGAAADIRAASNNAAIDAFAADLSSQTQVRRLADEVLDGYPRLDVLVNNVGGFWTHRHVTADGLEHTFALNHLAAFLLTNLLLDRLKASAPARIVTVSSGVHTIGRLDFDDLQSEQTYSGQHAYNASKLANVMFTYELARRLQGSGVTATVLHPGVVRTAFGAEDQSTFFRLMLPLMRPFMKTTAQGAATSIYLASSPQVEGETGRYFSNSKPKKSSKASYDSAAALRLWRVSVDLVGPPTVSRN